MPACKPARVLLLVIEPPKLPSAEALNNLRLTAAIAAWRLTCRTLLGEQHEH
jgi:hypothetical protein